MLSIWSTITSFLTPRSIINNEEPMDELDTLSLLPSLAGTSTARDFQASHVQP